MRCSPSLRHLILSAVVVVELILLALSIPDHAMHIDEAWIGEQALSLARDGVVRSELFNGFAHNGDRIAIYHFLFVGAGSIFVDLFGWSIASLRAVSIVSGVALLILAGLSLRRISGELSLLTVAILLLSPLVFEHIKIYRPEILCAALGFASMLLLHRQGVWWSVIAGAIASLSMLTHPYGVIYVGAGFITLLVDRRWRDTLTLCVGSVLIAIPVALGVFEHWELARVQLANPLVANKTALSIPSMLGSLVNEHQRLFRTIRIAPMSVLFTIAIVYAIRRRDSSTWAVTRYSLLLVPLLGLIAIDKIDRYAILLAPFFAVVIAVHIERMFRKDVNRWWKFVTSLFVVVFAGYGVYFQISSAVAPRMPVARLNSEIARSIPHGATVVAPMNFIFDEIDNYDIAATKLATIDCEELRPECLVALMQRRGASYVVFSSHGFDAEEKMRDHEKGRALSNVLVSVRATPLYQIWKLP